MLFFCIPLLVFMLSIVVIHINTSWYDRLVVMNIIIWILLALVYHRFAICSIFMVIALFDCIEQQATNEVSINKSTYYYLFEPLTKNSCYCSYMLYENTIPKCVDNEQSIAETEKNWTIAYLSQNKKTIAHLKELGCYLITYSNNLVQLWFNDVVIDLSKDTDGSILLAESKLH